MKNIFELETLLVGNQFSMTNYPQIPLAVFNPAAYVKNGKLVILPRLVFDIRFYASSVGLTEPLKFSELGEFNYGARDIKTKLLKYPTEDYEIRGVEDSKITEDGKTILAVGVGKDSTKEHFTTQTIMLEFNGEKITSAKPFLFEGSEINTGRDAVFINDNVLLFRPEEKPLRTYRAYYDENDKNIVILEDGLKVLPELDAENGELKRGMSTNVVRLSENQNIVGWHAVFEDRLEYKEGFMIFNDNGEITGVSELILETSGMLRYGHRPFTLFGCGLVLVKDMLYFIGGVGDSWIGIFSAELNRVIEEIK